MALNIDQLRIVSYPHPVLRQMAKPLEKVTEQVQAVALKMLDLMHQARGVGLAAPQVGLSWRLFVANASGEPGQEHDQVFINPVLVQPGRQLVDAEEGCLSLSEIRGEVRRPQAITIQAMDITGASFELTSDDLPARIWQHETDHLDGVLIIDRMPPVDRMACKRALRELEQSFDAQRA